MLRLTSSHDIGSNPVTRNGISQISHATTHQ